MRAAFRDIRGLLILTAMVAGLLSGCTTLTGKSLGTNLDDAETTARIKAKLAKVEWQTLTRIDVDTNQGVVYLNGNVADEAMRRQAEQLARSVLGVRDVVNHLQVQPVPQQAKSAMLPAPGPAAGATAATMDCPPSAGGGSAAAGPAQQVEGRIQNLDVPRRRLQVGAVELDLAPDATILVNCNPAGAGKLREGARVKAAYEVRDGRNVATVVETEPLP